MADQTQQNSPTQQQNGYQQSPNGIDISSLLSSLMQQQSSSAGAPGTGGATGSAQPTGPYQKGVAKALTEYGYNHGAQALQAGVPPEHIQSHDLMTGGAGGQPGGGATNPQAMAVLQQLIQGQQGGQQTPQMPQGQMGAPGAQQGPPGMPTMPGGQGAGGQTPLQQQAGNLTAQPTNILQSMLQGFAQGTGYTGQRLENLGKAQQIQWGTPEAKNQLASAANTNAQTDYQQLTNQGQKPIDPEQYLSAYSNMYQKAYESYAKDEESGNQITQSALDQYNKLADTTRNAFQKGLGQSNPQMQKTLQAASASLKASIDARTNFHNFMFSNSPSQVIGSIKNKFSGQGSQQSDGNTSDVSGLKVGDKFNGEKIVNVKRVS